MDTCGKTNAEFRSDVNDILARHENSFDQVNAALQAVLTELQALRASRNPNNNSSETNPFARDESSQPHTSRLRDDIRIDVKIKQPVTLADTIGVARLIEERNQLQRRSTQPIRFQPTYAAAKSSSNPVAGVLGPPPSQRHNQDSPQTEIEDVEINQPDLEPSEFLPEISFHANTGTEHPQTLRVPGKLKSKNVTVLIDGGSTHNFIDQALVSRFVLPVTQGKQLQVMVANREKIKCAGQCQALTLIIQGHPVTTDYYILPVAACQLVLGVQWLATLGPVETDYKQLTMNFKLAGISHTFQGLGRNDIEALTDKELNGLQGLAETTTCSGKVEDLV
uniref:Retrotransposon gag domain-containing protein n=1 Tax=Populus alba TaxID=43335 RepID=A0A4U5P3W4_POPAL|nr:hypothetical protein D5086_0000233660 [Populus alba]